MKGVDLLLDGSRIQFGWWTLVNQSVMEFWVGRSLKSSLDGKPKCIKGGDLLWEASRIQFRWWTNGEPKCQEI